ncbi:Protein boule-like [Halotydeus destructor]|nr:Protein boule-like [Halotydeus destructor]
MTTLNAPRYGTTVPNRIFVGGITTDTSEHELESLFSRFGKVSAVKIINDRAGVPRGYGFITFETDDEAKRVLREGDNLILKGRKLNVAIAIKKQLVGRSIDSSHFLPSGTMAMFQPNNGLAFPTYPISEATHYFTASPESLYHHFNAAALAGSGLNQPTSGGCGAGAATSPGNPAGPTYPIIYQHPFYYAQPTHHLPTGFTSHHFPATGPPPTGGPPTPISAPGAHWPQYVMPQVMVNSHMGHV